MFEKDYDPTKTYFHPLKENKDILSWKWQAIFEKKS